MTLRNITNEYFKIILVQVALYQHATGRRSIHPNVGCVPIAQNGTHLPTRKELMGPHQGAVRPTAAGRPEAHRAASHYAAPETSRPGAVVQVPILLPPSSRHPTAPGRTQGIRGGARRQSRRATEEGATAGDRAQGPGTARVGPLFLSLDVWIQGLAVQGPLQLGKLSSWL